MTGRGSIDFKRIIILAGAIIALTIGSGFATGQEIMQYHASYGIRMVGKNHPETYDAIADAAAQSTKPAIVVPNQIDQH